MLINIITLSCAYNYGALLQTFGLYEFLSSLGHDVKIINYIPKRYDIESSENSDLWLRNSYKYNSSYIRRMIFKLIVFPSIVKSSIPFREFLRRNIKLTREYKSAEELILDYPQGDLFITGSDQVWNSDFLWKEEKVKEPIDSPYYLSFVHDSDAKIAYASSFGKSELSNEEKEYVKKYLKRYNAISVREESGKKILKNINIDSEIVADPTILCDKNSWRKIAGKRTHSKKYLLAFGINPDDRFLNLVKKIASHLNLPSLFLVTSNLFKAKHPLLDSVILPDVGEWLSLFRDSEFVITDSFHGTVFSTIYNKKFISIVSRDKSRFSGRITDYLSRIGLEDRCVNLKCNYKEIENIIMQDIDYEIVNIQREKFRLQSEKWLMDSIDRIKIGNNRNESKSEPC